MQSDADAWPDAKWDIGGHLHPWRRLAGEPVGHEGGRVLPEFAMPVHDPGAGPDLIVGRHADAADGVGTVGLPDDVRQWRIEPKRLEQHVAQAPPVRQILERADPVGRKSRYLTGELPVLLHVECEQIRRPEHQPRCRLGACEKHGRGLIANFIVRKRIAGLGILQFKQRIEEIATVRRLRLGLPLGDNGRNGGEPFGLKPPALSERESK